MRICKQIAAVAVVLTVLVAPVFAASTPTVAPKVSAAAAVVPAPVAPAAPASAPVAVPALVEEPEVVPASQPAVEEVAASVAPAAPVIVTPDQDPGAFAKQAQDALQNKNLRLLAALAVILLVWLCRTALKGKIPWLATNRGSALLALLWSFGVTFAAVFASNAPVGLQALVNATVLAMTSAGGWTLVKKIVAPSDKKKAKKAATPADPPAPPADAKA
jgi:hypothetical protein